MMDGMFCIQSGRKRGVPGGLVTIGPLDKMTTKPQDILIAAKKKFKAVNQHFNEERSFTLVYADGKLVHSLPDGSAPFSIKGLKQFLGIPYDRLRLYLCEKGNYFILIL